MLKSSHQIRLLVHSTHLKGLAAILQQFRLLAKINCFFVPNWYKAIDKFDSIMFDIVIPNWNYNVKHNHSHDKEAYLHADTCSIAYSFGST